MLDTNVAADLRTPDRHAGPPAAPVAGAWPPAAARTPVPALAANVLAPNMLGAVLDEIDYAVMVVDAADGELLHANRLAIEELSLRRTLELIDGHLFVADSAGQRAMSAALAAVRQGRRSLLGLRPAAGSGEAGRAASGAAEPIRVSVVPIGADAGPPRALLVFGKREVADELSVGFFARAHALTPTEDAVLQALCRGRRPAQIASDHGVAISTVRTQVNSIRAKTGTSSIPDLINRVAALPPMAPVLRRCTH
jgi:DNA-binding CsgD family transcriptional regulator